MLERFLKMGVVGKMIDAGTIVRKMFTELTTWIGEMPLAGHVG